MPKPRMTPHHIGFGMDKELWGVDGKQEKRSRSGMD